MNKQFLVIIFSFLFIKFYAQNNAKWNVIFLELKMYQSEFEEGVPFSEICIVDLNDSLIKCAITDFDGYAKFHLSTNQYNFDSIFFRVRLLQGHVLKGNKIKTVNEYGEPELIALNKIKLLKEICLEKSIKFAVTEYKILKKRTKEIEPMPCGN